MINRHGRPVNRYGKTGCDIRIPFDTSRVEPSKVEPSRVCLASLLTPEIHGYGDLTQVLLRLYAKKHGFFTMLRSVTLDPSRPPSWSKLLLAQEAFQQGYEWFCWIDADAFVVDVDRDIRVFLDERYDFIVGDAAPHGPVQMGVFFARNCPAVKDFLATVWNKEEFIQHSYWEQAAVWDVFRDGCSLKVKLVPQRWFNSPVDDLEPFITHYAGWPANERVDRIMQHARSLILQPDTWEDIPGWFDFEEIYATAVQEARDGDVFVEVGSWLGRSAAYLAAKIRESGKRIKLYAVDKWRDPDDFAGKFVANMVNCGLNCRMIQDDSALASRYFEAGSLALVFIDADHTERAVRRDIANWLPKIRPGGVLAGHDIDMPKVAAAVHGMLDPVETVGRSWRKRLPGGG